MYSSPFRHFIHPPKGALTVRLACFSHAASVRAEPGSNSSIQSVVERLSSPAGRERPRTTRNRSLHSYEALAEWIRRSESDGLTDSNGQCRQAANLPEVLGHHCLAEARQRPVSWNRPVWHHKDVRTAPTVRPAPHCYRDTSALCARSGHEHILAAYPTVHLPKSGRSGRRTAQTHRA